MAIATLRNLGGSVVMTVPKKLLELVNLDAGAKVDISVDGDRIVVQPLRKPSYKLKDLLARTKPRDFVLKDEDRQWMNSKPVGKEVW
jgi:antitoxin ChpS